jgi:hypothetical protein
MFVHKEVSAVFHIYRGLEKRCSFSAPQADTTMLPVAVAFAVESTSRTILLASEHANSRVTATQNAPSLSGAAAVATHTHVPLFICDSVNGQTGEFVDTCIDQWCVLAM